MITLRDDIGRTVVVDNMSSLVLRKNPSVFQSIYKPYNPSELKKGCVWSVDKRNDQDSCKMTLLHRVAFYGKVNIFEELLANNQVTVEDLTRHDDVSFTPFYVAALCHHRDMCSVILDSTVKLLSPEKLKESYTKKTGFLQRALWDALKYQRFDAFHLILKTFRKIMGRNISFDLLASRFCLVDRSVSLLSKIPENEFECVVKTITSITDSQNETIDHGHLCDWINHDPFLLFRIPSIKSENIDFKRFYSEKDLTFWKKNFALQFPPFTHPDNCLLCTPVWNSVENRVYKSASAEISKFLNSISIHLDERAVKELLLYDDVTTSAGFAVVLRAAFLGGKQLFDAMMAHLSEGNRNEIVECFTKNSSQIIGRFRHPDLLDLKMSYEIGNALEVFPTFCDQTQLLNLINVMTTSTRASHSNTLWSHFANKGDIMNIRVRYIEEYEDISNFLRNVSEKLGEGHVEKLLLHHDEEGHAVIWQVLLSGRKGLFDLMLRHLSNESQSDIKKNIPRLITNTLSNDSSFSEKENFDILFEYIIDDLLNYFDLEQLSTFVDIITTCHMTRQKNYSIWGDYIKKHQPEFDYFYSYYNRTEAFLELVSEKLKDLNYLKKLLFHDVGAGVMAIVRATLRKGCCLFCMQLKKSSEKYRAEISQSIAENALTNFADLVRLEKSDFWSEVGDFKDVKFSNILKVFPCHFNQEQLFQFVDIITTISVHDIGGRKRSIWGGCVDKSCSHDIGVITKFLKQVSEQLDYVSVKKLVLHDDGYGNGLIVVLRTALRGRKTLYKFMLNQLTQADRDEIRLSITRNATQTIEYFVSPHFLVNWDVKVVFGKLLKVYSEYFDSPQNLETFIGNILSSHSNKCNADVGGNQYSTIWDNYLYKSIYERKAMDVDEFLQHIYRKLGVKAVKQLVLPAAANGADEPFRPSNIILARLRSKKLFKTMLGYLDMSDRDKVDIVLRKHGPETVQEVFFSGDMRHCIKFKAVELLNALLFFLDYSSHDQLLKFVGIVTTVHIIEGKRRSIWGYFMKEFRYTTTTVAKVLNRVGEKLGENAVKLLLLHKDENVLMMEMLRTFKDNS